MKVHRANVITAASLPPNALNDGGLLSPWLREDPRVWGGQGRTDLRPRGLQGLGISGQVQRPRSTTSCLHSALA